VPNSTRCSNVSSQPIGPPLCAFAAVFLSCFFDLMYYLILHILWRAVSYCEAMCTHKPPPAPSHCMFIGGTRWLYTSHSGEQSKYTIAQAEGQCTITVSGGCDGCGPGPPGTPPGWRGPSPGTVDMKEVRRPLI
jgi:hypothetical protein